MLRRWQIEPSYIWHAHITSTTWWVSLLVERVSQRAHVAKFYIQLQLIRSVFDSIKIFRVEIYLNCNFVDLLHGIPFGFSFFWYFCDISFQLFKLLCLAKNHWWGFCTRNAYMVHIVNEIQFKMVHTSWSLFIFQPLHSLGKCHCWWTRESLRAHAAKFYGWLQLIRSVSRASTFSVLKFIEIVIFGVYLSSLLASVCFGTVVISLFNFLATLFGLGSLMMVQYSKCAYGPYY